MSPFRQPCPTPPQRRWELPGAGSETTFRLASLADVQVADGWPRRAADTHGWSWETVLRGADECVYALGSPTWPVAALFGTRPKNLDLTCGPTRRLNFFQIDPGLRGTGFARLSLAAFGRLVTDAAGKALAIAALPAPKVIAWYVEAGAVEGSPPGWTCPNGLVAVWFDPARLERLVEYSDAVEA